MSANFFYPVLFACFFLLSCGNGEETIVEENDPVADFEQELIGERANHEALLDEFRWELFEINGRTIEPSSNPEQQPYINFSMADTTVGAFAGCNSMGGKYILEEGQRIRFEKLHSTLMACDDMSLETELTEVLEKTDNYTLNNSILSLNKARMAPLARFRAVAE